MPMGGTKTSSSSETTTTKLKEENGYECSPRGVLETHVSRSDSGNSSSSFDSEKSMGSEFGNGNLHLKKFLGQIKKRSERRLSTIPLLPFLGGNGLVSEMSKKEMRRRFGRNHSAEESVDCGGFVMTKPTWRNFTYQELSKATDGFSTDKLIGKGGHADVYRGLLPDGQVVAVKKITKEEKNDEDRVGDFLAELGIIAHIDHPNAAKLIGFSSERGLYLVLKFCTHGSLATVLHGCEDCLDWRQRYKVALGLAEGLEYLHFQCQRRIVHRDITASNILLSQDYDAQISDFGLAKWLPEKWVHHVVSPIEGTFGYMAPEYFMHGIVHEKTDVFAFGVLLLELITGREAVDNSSKQSLAMWAKPHLEMNNVKEMADPRLGDAYNVTEMQRAMYTASTCIHHLPNMRPNMKRVVKLLKGESVEMDIKQKSMGGKALMVDACDLEGYTSTTYLNDLNRHMELVME